MQKASLLLFLIVLFSCTSKIPVTRKQIDLKGEWQFALDTGNVGIEQQWFSTSLNDSIKLPGTTDLNKKGFLNKHATTMHLNRVYTWEGPAWYRKKVVVPDDFQDKHIVLSLERSKPSKIWIDEKLVGSSMLLESPQQFDVTSFLPPGEHFITIRVDNSLKLTPYGNVHIYSDDTQTNWNGILGKIYLEASAKTYISNLQVYPDTDNKKIKVKMEVENGQNLSGFDIKLQVEKISGGKTKQLRTANFSADDQPELELEYQLGDDCELWDEFNQPLYKLTALISSGEIKDSKTVPFGMRNFTVKGTQFEINGRKTFLRGKHEAAVFPLTGFPPMDVEGWARVYRIAKSYGINHYRFHSYCPPEAAFTAADQEGIYLQAETPFWGELKSDTLAKMLLDEGMGMLKAYANHPSFVMFSNGNEIGGSMEKPENNIAAFKAYDNRPLYTMGSNNGIGYTPPSKSTEFFVGARIPGDNQFNKHTRLTHAFADATDGGILNSEIPSTEINFDYAVSQMDMPLISHEIGQYQIYPDYSEIEKYTGVLRAGNLEIFRDRLEQKGMLDQDLDFQKASGAWSALCYKAEMEAAIRTRGMAGFQLLDLQDFPGQGTALVGILDAFMDSKGVVSREEWLQSCNDVVLLSEFPKYCWTTDEIFNAEVIVANYSNKEYSKGINWAIKNEEGEIILSDSFQDKSYKMGELTSAGEIKIELSDISAPEKLTLEISLPGSAYSNSYPLWVYPSPQKEINSNDIMISEKLNSAVFQKLQQGGKVLLFPKTEDIKENSYAGHFPPEFWNWGMFKGISEWAKKPVSPGTLGLLTNPEHPVFKEFPTDFHTNWQWFSIIKASNSLILDDTPQEYRPIVQIIDNLERNHKLGLLFEFKIGDGKLLVCMSQLETIMDKPEAAQFYKSLIDYINSDAFSPEYQLTTTELKDLI